jgi:histidyl-tRNA synthetase
MGDVVLGILLAEKGKLPALGRQIEYFVIEADQAARPKVLEVVGALRHAGLSADFNYRPQALGKQLKAANRRGARCAVIVRPDGITVKDLSSGAQRDTTLAELLKAPAGAEHSP